MWLIILIILIILVFITMVYSFINQNKKNIIQQNENFYCDMTQSNTCSFSNPQILFTTIRRQVMSEEQQIDDIKTQEKNTYHYRTLKNWDNTISDFRNKISKESMKCDEIYGVYNDLGLLAITTQKDYILNKDVISIKTIPDDIVAKYNMCLNNVSKNI